MKIATKELPIKGEVFTVEGHTAFLILPDLQAPDTKTPWIWYAPTLPGLPGDAEVWMFRRFLDAGIAVDATVPLEENSGELARRYRQFGGEITLIVPGGQGHNMWQGFFQCQELLDFVIAHSGIDIDR